MALPFGLVAACNDAGHSELPPPPSPLVEFSVAPTFVLRDATTSQAFVPPATVSLAFSEPPDSPVWIGLDHTGNGIQSATFASDDADSGAISIRFKAPVEPGTRSDTLTIHVCHDQACLSEVANSPVTVSVQYRVHAVQRRFSDDPLPITGQTPLGHNVLDAEYSAGLDAVVMVASAPANALHVHYPGTGAAQSVALDAVPRSVSLTPDGLMAAVAHDSLITLVDLALLGDPLLDATTVLNVSTAVYETVLPGNGYVYAFPVNSGQYLKTIEIATGAETEDWRRWISSRMPARAHPAMDRIYGVTFSSPDDVERIDITGGTAMVAYDSPYHGKYDNCFNLWLHEAGERIFTACGHLYRTSDEQARDMLYAGSLPLASERFYAFGAYHGSVVKSLSQTAERGEIVLLEENNDDCVIKQDTCRTHLSLYEDGYYNLEGRYTIPPLEMDGVSHRQRGTHVFHSADGMKRYLVTRIEATADPEREFWLGAANVGGNVVVPTPESPPAATLGASTEPAYLRVPQADLQALPHDVVDAEFSAALDAIVMVSRFPSSAVHVYDVASGDEFSIPLPAPPTSVSVSPDGLHAAVGHDALITHMALSAEAPHIVPLDGTLKTFDVVSGGNGWVYGLPAIDQWMEIHSIDVATNEETLSSSIYAGSHARLQPGGTDLYLVGPDFASTIDHLSTANGVPQFVKRADHHAYGVCGDLWFSESGSRLYTACGRVYDIQLAPVGTLPLLDADGAPWRVAFASHSDERNEIALIENHPTRCASTATDTCLSHVNFYTAHTLALARRYALAPVTVGDSAYPQRGLFVFHNSNGTERYLVTRLAGASNPWATYYVSRVLATPPGS